MITKVQLGCIHSETACTEKEVTCNLRPVRITHGWLCIGHWRQQVLPKRPNTLRMFMDAADILPVEREAIKKGVTRVLRLGSINPTIIKFLEA